MVLEKAFFAAGCFWGIEEAFGKIKGVKSTMVGYMGGITENPTYQKVCSGETGHAETVQVEFDSKTVSFKELLEAFWKMHNPTTLNRQGLDFGTQYRSIIFYHSEEQKIIAIESKEKMEKSDKFSSKIVTEIMPATIFYKAEDYHQKYHQKSFFDKILKK